MLLFNLWKNCQLIQEKQYSCILKHERQVNNAAQTSSDESQPPETNRQGMYTGLSRQIQRMQIGENTCSWAGMKEVRFRTM
jgi:hypothetical protein